MNILAVAVVLLATLVVVNTAITFAALRRLREYGQQLGFTQPGSPPPVAELLGQVLPAVAMTAIDGTEMGTEELRERPWLIGFFSATCKPCRTEAPLFAAATEPHRLAVAVTDHATDAERSALLALLAGTPYVIVESGSGGLSGSLAVRTFPTFLRTDDSGKVVMADNSVQSLHLQP